MGNELATQQDALLTVIERVASNPEADVTKLEKMLDMQERIMDKNAESAFNKAMVKAMSEIPSFEEAKTGASTKGGVLMYKYATFEQINKVVKPILAANGLFMSFTTDFKDGGVYVTAVITHQDGHAKQSTGLYPFDTSGQKNQIQAVGSAISYGKRYQQNALLNITTHGEDDDGFASQKKIDAGQIKELNRGLIKAGAKSTGLCEYLSVEKLSDISADDYSAAIQFIQNLIGAQKSE